MLTMSMLGVISRGGRNMALLVVGVKITVLQDIFALYLIYCNKGGI